MSKKRKKKSGNKAKAGQLHKPCYRDPKPRDCHSTADRKAHRVKGRGSKSPSPLHSNMKRAQCQTVMDTVIYILCGVSITLAVCSIVINVRRRKRGRKQEKD